MALYKKGFMGNRLIRAAGVPIEWDHYKLSEFKRCSEDPLYFIETYIKIKHVDYEEMIAFIPRFYQREMLDKMLTKRWLICKLPRQVGKTLLVSAALLWHVLFHQNMSVLCAAHKGDKARDVLSMIKSMFENLPEFLQMGVIEYNKGTLILENGSRIRASATSGSSARGDTYNIVYIDEAGFIAPHVADEFFKSVIPTISSGTNTKIFITSTPKGLNHFYTMWKAAISGQSGYDYVEIKWNDVPGRDEKFKREVVSQFGEEYFAQEFAAEFIGSSRTLIAGHVLTSIPTMTPIHESEHSRVYSDPDPDRQYAVTVDVSEGLGEDSSAIVVFDVTELPYSVVSVYQNNLIEPMALPGVVHEIATAYNEALVLVEANFGQQIGDILYTEYEYENLVFTTKGKTGIHAKFDKISSSSTKHRVGLAWNAHSKRIGCTNLKSLIERDQLIINDQWIYDELTHFVVSKRSYAADSGHDDLAMCLVLFAWMVDQGYVRDSTDTSIRNRIRDLNAEALEREMMPLGFNSTHDELPEAIEITRPGIEIPDPETLEGSPFDGLFDQKSSRGGMSELELHDAFMRDMFNPVREV